MADITLTGVDERTSINDIICLADMGAEIGILYSFSPDGRNRYPDFVWILHVAIALKGRASIHICGARARDSLLRGDLNYLLREVRRFQVNGIITPEELQIICNRYTTHTIITQHAARNVCLAEIDVRNHSILVDGSGGRGILPREWKRPETTKPVGFAGGLGPDNLRNELPSITRAAKEPWWIDMEGRLRVDDWFSVKRARFVMEIWNDWNNGKILL